MTRPTDSTTQSVAVRHVSQAREPCSGYVYGQLIAVTSYMLLIGAAALIGSPIYAAHDSNYQ